MAQLSYRRHRFPATGADLSHAVGSRGVSIALMSVFVVSGTSGSNLLSSTEESANFEPYTATHVPPAHLSAAVRPGGGASLARRSNLASVQCTNRTRSNSLLRI